MLDNLRAKAAMFNTVLTRKEAYEAMVANSTDPTYR
jgi:hypothetical protein